jgi:hypothetical protein
MLWSFSAPWAFPAEDWMFCEEMACEMLFESDKGCPAPQHCRMARAFQAGCIMMLDGEGRQHYIGLLPGRSLN